MKKRNIYQNQSQEILALFERAKDRSKVMCIPRDYTKKIKGHMVMFCNGNGKILKKPFSIKNTPEGVEYLIDQVTRSYRHHGIDIKHTEYFEFSKEAFNQVAFFINMAIIQFVY